MHQNVCQGCGFSRSQRIVKPSEYDAVFRHAKKITNRHFIFLYHSNQVGRARLGLALSKKNIAKAHDRTRLKRLIRETFRVIPDLPAIDIVVLVKSGVAREQNAILIDGLRVMWSKLTHFNDSDSDAGSRPDSVTTGAYQPDQSVTPPIETSSTVEKRVVTMNLCQMSSKSIGFILRGLIRVYQWTISPLLPKSCRFDPSCSEYSIQAITQSGPLRGLWKSLGRVLRCHPWSIGGYDPVLPNKEK